MMFRIEWCVWQRGGDDADQAWHECVPNAGVDLSSRADCEAEARELDIESEGRYVYRVVETGDEPEQPPLRKTTVQRFDARTGKWFDVELEIAS